jgi:hypothetical protein
MGKKNLLSRELKLIGQVSIHHYQHAALTRVLAGVKLSLQGVCHTYFLQPGLAFFTSRNLRKGICDCAGDSWTMLQEGGCDEGRTGKIDEHARPLLCGVSSLLGVLHVSMNSLIVQLRAALLCVSGTSSLSCRAWRLYLMRESLSS